MFQPRFATPIRPISIVRLLLVAGLAVVLGTLLVHVRPPEPTVLPADVLYRLSVFLRTSGDMGKAYALQQMALAVYEKNALSASPSAPAVYRLGIFYAKLGYPDHGRQFLRHATKLDESHRSLYRLLLNIYGDGALDKSRLLNNISLLEEQPRWLAELTKADMYERIGDAARSQQVRRQWHHRQFIFGLVISALLTIYGLLGCTGLAILIWAFVRLAHHPTQRRPPRVYVPWQMLDMTEVLVVMVLVMSGLGMAAGELRAYLHLSDAPGTIEAVMVTGVYLLAVGVTLALIRYRLRSYPRPWHMLGLRLDALAARVGWGVAGYGVFVCLLVVGVLALRKLGLVGELPPLLAQLKGPVELVAEARTPAAYLLYFVVMCLIGPVVEEIIFRGFIYAGLRRVMGMAPAMLLSAAVFAAVHISVSTAGMLFVGLMALVLAYLYEHSRSVVPSAVAHCLHNTLTFIILAAYGLL